MIGSTCSPQEQLLKATVVCNKVNGRPVELLRDPLVCQVLYGPDKRKQREVFHAVPILIDEILPTIESISKGGREVIPWLSACHRYDFLVCLYQTDLLFSNFLLYSSLGIDHVFYDLCSHDLCLFFSSCFIPSHDHMAKRSHYRIMIFSFWSTTILRTHLHPRFLPSPLRLHHPYTPRLR